MIKLTSTRSCLEAVAVPGVSCWLSWWTILSQQSFLCTGLHLPSVSTGTPGHTSPVQKPLTMTFSQPSAPFPMPSVAHRKDAQRIVKNLYGKREKKNNMEGP